MSPHWGKWVPLSPINILRHLLQHIYILVIVRSSTIDNLSEYRPYAEYKINKLNAMLIVVSFAIFPSSKILIVTFWSYESLSFKTLKIPYGLILFIHFSILTRLIQTDVSKTMPKMSKKTKKSSYLVKSRKCVTVLWIHLQERVKWINKYLLSIKLKVISPVGVVRVGIVWESKGSRFKPHRLGRAYRPSLVTRLPVNGLKIQKCSD